MVPKLKNGLPNPVNEFCQVEEFCCIYLFIKFRADPGKLALQYYLVKTANRGLGHISGK